MSDFFAQGEEPALRWYGGHFRGGAPRGPHGHAAAPRGRQEAHSLRGLLIIEFSGGWWR